ncbi:aminomethyltransferase [Acidobacteriota bacterium]|nr:aminomethyltransferase [Acidobacteriota bacterium]
MNELKRTPLYEIHRSLNAKLVDFGGWEMPIQYPSGIIAEHLSVRTGVGLFDVCHMGEFNVKGKGAYEFIDGIVPSNLAKIANNQAMYSALLNEKGTFIDDLLIYRYSQDHFLLVVNASNIEKDFLWLTSQLKSNAVELTNISSETGLLAIQGPKTVEILSPVIKHDLKQIPYYHFLSTQLAGVDILLSRTGYTGEDGFEIYCPSSSCEDLWTFLLNLSSIVKPAGLGARNTLRLEARMSLYGHEIDDSTNPFEAGLKWIVDMDKPQFTGKQALVEIASKPLSSKLVGFKTLEKRDIPRDGMIIYSSEGPVGRVTSAGPSPTTKENIGLAYVPLPLSSIGSRLEIDIRGRRAPIELVKVPFYQRKRS